jgi:hypothetical protein
MNPADAARADQLRAGIRDAIAHPCDCGACPTVEELLEALALDDKTLLQLLRP